MGEPCSLEEGCISMGPWGGPGGNKWSYRAKGGIKQIVIAHGGVIDSIVFESCDGNGSMEYSMKFGGNGGDRSDKINIDWPMEYLTGISGRYGSYFGQASAGYITLGPWGGPDGNNWSHRVNGGIKQIVIGHGSVIDSIGIKSDDGVDMSINAGMGGYTDTVDIDWPGEYLSGISGTYGTYTEVSGNVLIGSLSFYTNLKTYGPFGTNSGGTSFNIPMDGDVIIGFHGRAGTYLNAIGVYIKPTDPEE